MFPNYDKDGKIADRIYLYIGANDTIDIKCFWLKNEENRKRGKAKKCKFGSLIKENTGK